MITVETSCTFELCIVDLAELESGNSTGNGGRDENISNLRQHIIHEIRGTALNFIHIVNRNMTTGINSENGQKEKS